MRIEWSGKGKLTKKRALFLCWKLWEWLGKDGIRDKDRWPHWKRNGGEVNHMLYHCPVCEKAGGFENCKNCLLIDYWPMGCMDEDSTFIAWQNAGYTPEATKYARRIAAAAKRLYEKL